MVVGGSGTDGEEHTESIHRLSKELTYDTIVRFQYTNLRGFVYAVFFVS